MDNIILDKTFCVDCCADTNAYVGGSDTSCPACGHNVGSVCPLETMRSLSGDVDHLWIDGRAVSSIKHEGDYLFFICGFVSSEDKAFVYRLDIDSCKLLGEQVLFKFFVALIGGRKKHDLTLFNFSWIQSVAWGYLPDATVFRINTIEFLEGVEVSGYSSTAFMGIDSAVETCGRVVLLDFTLDGVLLRLKGANKTFVVSPDSPAFIDLMLWAYSNHYDGGKL